MINKQLPGALLLLVITSFSSFVSTAQIRWDGGGGDHAWTTAANWAGDIIPAATDDVLLDNHFVSGNYMVHLPVGNVLVTVRSLSIQPVLGKTIEVVLPAGNTATPAFVASGPGYGLRIEAGGLFRNASGINSGVAVQVADSLKLGNSGRFVQQCLGAHAALVQVLSGAAGTEEGIFEFDIPDASTTVSMSNRVYGKLVFSATANGGVAGYTAAGTNPITVRSDLEIGAGVTLSLNSSDTLFIRRHLLQQGGILNLGTAARRLITVVAGNLLQEGGTIRETGLGALPEIIAMGASAQLIKLGGSITDSVTIAINNPAGVTLQSAVTLPYKLRLISGRVTTSASTLLTLSQSCTLEADSAVSHSFINGPLRKEGLQAADHFLFPVGKDQVQRWIALKNATGNFVVEFVKSNPNLLNGICGPGIHHISNVEHWKLSADVFPLPTANVELSFNDANSGVVTDLAALRVAQLAGGTWVDAGNVSVSGAAGANGSVTSEAISLFAPQTYFTLAGSTASSNPLPLRPIVRDQRNNSNQHRGIVLQSVNVQSGMASVVIISSGEETWVQLQIVGMDGRMITRKVLLQKGINNIDLTIPAWAGKVFTVYAVHGKGRSNLLRFVK